MLQRLGAVAKSGPYIAGAALAVVVVVERTRFAISDGSRAIQSMILTAWSEGIGSNWVGFMGPDEAKPLLNIPESMDLLAIIPFGYPAQTTGQGKKQRKSLAEVAHRGQFGQPFETH
jgi:nitroreductase